MPDDLDSDGWRTGEWRTIEAGPKVRNTIFGGVKDVRFFGKLVDAIVSWR